MTMKLYKVNGKWDYKLPYIDDRDLFKAVMQAIDLIKWHREQGHTVYFRRSINFCARKYNVNPAEVEKYVRIVRSSTSKIESARRRGEEVDAYATEY